MYLDIHEPAQCGCTALELTELIKVITLPLNKRNAIREEWKRIDTLIFRTNPTKGNN